MIEQVPLPAECSAPRQFAGSRRRAAGSIVRVLTATQLDEFSHRGILRVSSFVTEEIASVAAARVWEVLSDRGVRREDSATWPEARQQKLQAISRADVYLPFAEQLARFADQVLGAGRWRALNAGGPLVTFPERVPWQIPHKGWHFDLPARGSVERPVALRLLGLVESVEPRGGGTLVVEGTHELTRRLVSSAAGNFGHSADVRKRLAATYEWFRHLFSEGRDRERFFVPAEIDGVSVRVTELTGDAGDAYLMHPWLLHAAGPNTSNRMRSMMTHTVFGDGYRFVA